MALLQAACLESGLKGEDVSPADLQEHASSSQNIFELGAADVPEADKHVVDMKVPRDDSAVVGVPEHSHPGESASNGKAEAAVKQVMDMTRTLKVASEARLKLNKPLPSSHPVVA